MVFEEKLLLNLPLITPLMEYYLNKGKIYFEGKSHPKGSNSSFKVYSRRENGTFRELTKSLVGDKKTGWKVLLGQ